MKVYLIDKITHEYINTSKDAQVNPLWKEGDPVSEQFLMPYLSIPTDPGENTGDNKVWIGDPIGKTWSEHDDYRGQSYWEQDGTEKKIIAIDEQFPSGTLQTGPPTAFHTTHNGTEWIYDLVSAKTYYNYALENEKRVQLENAKVSIDGVEVLDLETDTFSTADGVVFDADIKASDAYKDVKEELEDDPSFEDDKWKSSNGYFCLMNKALYIKLAPAVRAKRRDIIHWFKDRSREVKLATNQTEIEEVSLTYS